MVARSSILFLTLFALYCAIPFLFEVINLNLFINVSYYAIFTYITLAFGFLKSSKREFSDEIVIKSLKILNFSCASFCIYAIYSTGIIASNEDLIRENLFEIRESIVNQYITLSFNFLIVSSIILSKRNKNYLSFLVIPVIFDYITQGRSLIAMILVAIIFVGSIRPSALFILVALFISITFSRILENFPLYELTMGTALEYLFAEPMNTALGTSLVEEGAYSISLSQGLRPLLAFFPFVGEAFVVPSEAMDFNYLLRDTRGVYGLAFGVLGFAKYSSLWVCVFSLVSAWISIRIFIILGLPRNLIAMVYVASMLSYFRWSPGESLFLAGRMSLILAVLCLAVSMFSSKRRASSLVYGNL